MSELEPHHHIIRRAGYTLNKHLNLTDEALITRLIGRGCIAENDREKYTGKTKRVKDRFIARFQNQPYEVFLSFVECLREDTKYAQLVDVLDEALAEYGPSDVTTTDTKPTPTQPGETTIQLGSDSLTVATSTIPLSNDLPIIPPLPVVMETDTDITPATNVSKQKLKRQSAVTEGDENPPTTTAKSKMDDIVEDITTPMTKLSIETKGGDYPRLPFIGDQETRTFTSEGGELFSSVHNFHIEVPPNAVPPGCYATLHVRGCCYGPFKLPQGCKACSDFIFVEMEGIDSFQLPVLVEISHNLVIEDYVKCHEVSIYRCNYNMTHPSHQQYPIVFNKITEPDVSDKMKIFSLKMKTFCGLCAVYEETKDRPYLRPKSAISDDHQLHRSFSGSTENAPVKIPSTDGFSSCDSFESDKSSRKRKQMEQHSTGSAEKQMHLLEYHFLCYWPLSLKSGALSVVIFVCRDCTTSTAACNHQVEEMSAHSKSAKSLLHRNFEFSFDESKRVVVEVDSPLPKGWNISKRSAICEVHESDIHTVVDDSHEHDHTEWQKKLEKLMKKVDNHFYPPMMILDIYYHKEHAIVEHCDVTLQVTGSRNILNKDTSVTVHAHSDMYGEQPELSSPFDDVFDLPTYEITNGILVQIGIKINKIKQVVRALGYDSDFIERLEADYPTHDEVCYRVLLQWWHCPKHNSTTKLKDLQNSLCKTGQSGCLRKVFMEIDNYSNITYVSNESRISEKTLASDINGNQKFVYDLARHLSGKWRLLGSLLDLEECEIEEIQSDYDKSVERAYRMLEKWKQKKGSAAKIFQLVVALLVVEKYEALKVIEKNMIGE